VERPSELPLYYSWHRQCHQNAFFQYFLYLQEQKKVTVG
jgi:hypothetical protein